MVETDPWEPKERIARLREAVEILDLLLRAEASSYEGPHYRFHDAVMNPLPIQRPRPPLVIGANGPATLKVGGAACGPCGTPSEGSTCRRKSSTSERLSGPASARTICAALGRDQGRLSARSFSFHPWTHGPRPAFGDLVGRYSELGFSEFVVYAPEPEQEEAFQVVTDEVMPKLRLDLSWRS